MHSFSQFASCGAFYDLLTIYRYKRGEDAKMALEQMEGFELAGRTVSILIDTVVLLMDHDSSVSIPFTRRAA